MNIKKYLEESLVTPDLLTSSYCQFANYNGVAPVPKYEDSVYYDPYKPNNEQNKTLYKGEADFNKGNHLSLREMAFENYLVAIKTLLGDNPDLQNLFKKSYYQGQIDLQIETLVTLANSYIDKDAKKIKYDDVEFSKMAKVYPNLAKIEPFMPSVIYYVALRQGWDLKYPNEYSLSSNKPNSRTIETPLKNEEIEYNSSYKINDKDMLMSIGGRFGINYEKYTKKDILYSL